MTLETCDRISINLVHALSGLEGRRRNHCGQKFLSALVHDNSGPMRQPPVTASAWRTASVSPYDGGTTATTS